MINFSKLKFAVGWQAMSQSIQAITNIVYLMVMGRIVSKEAFGVFALASVVIAYINMFTEFGLGAALIQKKKISKEEISFTFYANLFIALILLIIVIVIAPFVIAFYDYKFTMVFLLFLASQLIIKSLSIVSRALLTRDLDFKRIFFSQSIGYIFGCFFVGVPLAMKGYGEWALAFSLISTASLTSLLMFLFKRHSIRFPTGIFKFRDIISYGLQLTKVRLVNQSAHQVDKLLIGKFFNEATLGIYERFQKIIMMPETYIGRLSDSIAFSSLSRVKDDKPNLSKYYFDFLLLMVLIIIPICSVMYVYAEEIIYILLGSEWVEDYRILQWMTILIFIQTFSRYSDTLVRVTASFSQSFQIKMFFLILSAISILYACQYSIFHVIGALILTKLCHSLLMLRLSKLLSDYDWADLAAKLIPVVILGVYSTFITFGVHLLIGGGIVSLLMCLLLLFGSLSIIVLKFPQVLQIQSLSKYIDQFTAKR